MPMLELQADRCTGCGLSVADWPRKILELREGRPVLAPEREASCFRCLHCFAVCPGGAISIHGNHPEASRPLAGSFPDPEALETLVQGQGGWLVTAATPFYGECGGQEGDVGVAHTPWAMVGACRDEEPPAPRLRRAGRQFYGRTTKMTS